MYKKKKYILPPISLYIHIPWCIKKCPYCDFHSYKYSKKISEDKYIYHIIKDLKKDIKIIENREIKSIFIGGGTPSLLKSNTIKLLILKIKKIMHISKKIEISIEINPDDHQKKKIIEYHNAGVNRFSIGVQTFKNNLLKKIERNYEKKSVIKLINVTKNIENRNLNIDIMYGLPQQTIQDALDDLIQTINLKPEHISWYQLDIEPNTQFYTKNISLPSIVDIKKISSRGKRILKKSGYKQYEISAFSREKKYQCIHNLNYWNFGDYIGIGCGAHGKITQLNKKIIRTIKTKNDYMYIQKNYIEKKYIVSKKDIPFEFFLNKFRLLKPISYSNFENSTNLKIKIIQEKILTAKKKGYLIDKNNCWNVTPYGRKHLNSLLSIFI
ncbi:Oxygen-independent coproporphyrinogen-III oxidase-like protein YggW [Buchnera aphidicola (Cinara piceae)]|uniref:Heme chaperone HemW n=1 Tax=Buchnera aphidicola (Cinara piceae) TaxID=1660043 RepID=A0A803FUG9_9GAMM|nr:radical SAM family heme chaperone HemW [Buchnera aphidicola]VFP88776.1 Oxygen-independent coproporphyrinogen-III oxidase-like protein YggW [Buchnera aphidicola (Cinara piceae)]